MRKSSFKLKFFYLLGMFLALVILFAVEAKAKVYPVELVEAYDGDTVRLKFENDFEFDARLVWIDAPELEQPFGREAREQLIQFLTEKPFKAAFFGEDRFNRKLVLLLRDTFVEINYLMVSNGYAWLYSVKRNEKERYLSAWKTAYFGQFGLWSEENPCQPRKFRRGGCN